MLFPILLHIKNKLIKTQMELLQAQFEYVFKVRILAVYQVN